MDSAYSVAASRSAAATASATVAPADSDTRRDTCRRGHATTTSTDTSDPSGMGHVGVAVRDPHEVVHHAVGQGLEPQRHCRRQQA